MLFPNVFEVDLEEVRVVVDEGGLQGDGFAAFRLQVVFGHVRSRHGKTMKGTLKKFTLNYRSSTQCD